MALSAVIYNRNVKGGHLSALCAAPPLRFRRGRRPAVERSGTNALGVRRPVSAAALSFRASAHTGVGIRFLVGAMPTSARHYLTKTDKRLIIHPKDAAINGRRLVTAPRGGDIYVLDTYFPHRAVFRFDSCYEVERQKPPPCTVTVSVI